ncbi:DUF5336 domain-containing protein [Antrihabitans stalactiti]|uniref:Uncharacterized protein n=1 Tax=Antrihabitans stalactiti TaxID=2584121 RepID=A0A848KA85_9NOCA|nr:hypothetical protein [Antrihabitans stalactiti]NMN94378.1 hypothetical protein [Antrihabitans stalactiti]
MTQGEQPHSAVPSQDATQFYGSNSQTEIHQSPPSGWQPQIEQQPQQYPPQQQFGPPSQQFGPPQQFAQQPYPQVPQGPSAWPLHRIAAVAVAVAGILGLVASLFSLYTTTVTPSKISDSEDIPSGSVKIGMGFYDTIPFNAPTIAVAIPILLLLAGLSAIPVISNVRTRPTGLPALLALSATLISLALMFSDPLPGIELTGGLAREFEDSTDGKSLDSLIGSVLSISPGIGLILSFVLGIIAAAGGVVLFLAQDKPPKPAPFQQPPAQQPPFTPAQQFSPEQQWQQGPPQQPRW